MADVPAELINRLVAARRAYQFPSQVRSMTHAFSGKVLATLFPHFAPEVVRGPSAVRGELLQVEGSLEELVGALTPTHAVPAGLATRFMAELAGIHHQLTVDAEAIFQGDPAARSIDEVILTYPGFLALATYRVANNLHLLGLPLVPRLLTEFAHEKTGIDIHPGAKIGASLCIDHGTGVVVGETCVIGNGVKLYQGVTLGAATVQKAMADLKRHPTIEDAVVIYAGATILGGDTVVGHDSVIAGNAWLTHSVPPFSVVSRAGEVRRRTSRNEAEALEFII